MSKEEKGLEKAEIRISDLEVIEVKDSVSLHLTSYAHKRHTEEQPNKGKQAIK
jgi:hypothetical protein